MSIDSAQEVGIGPAVGVHIGMNLFRRGDGEPPGYDPYRVLNEGGVGHQDFNVLNESGVGHQEFFVLEE